MELANVYVNLGLLLSVTIQLLHVHPQHYATLSITLRNEPL